MGRKLLVVDISSFIFRAFYAVRSLHAPDGRPVNAVYGVMSMLLKLLSTHRPDFVVLARDLPGGSFRKELYSEYKANRSATPEELLAQFPIIEELILKLKIPQLSQDKMEADDLIATIVKSAKGEMEEILIASGDKDLMQLVDDQVKMVDSMKDILYGPKEVHEKMGVYPHQIVDYLAMVGDTSDNIPGIAGIGPKGAEKLILEYGTLEEAYKHVDEITNARVKNALKENYEKGLLSKELVALKSDLDLSLTLDELKYSFAPNEELFLFLKELGFNSFIKKLEETSRYEDRAVSPVESNLESATPYQMKSLTALPLESLSTLQRGVPLYVILKGSEVSVMQGEHYFTIPTDSLSTLSHHYLIGYNLKELFKLMLNFKLTLPSSYEDLALMHYLLESEGKNSLENLAAKYLHYHGALESVEVELTLVESLFTTLSPMLQGSEQTVYETIEKPLISVLAKMERRGICLNIPFLAHLEKEYSAELDLIEQNIAELSQTEVNLKSPKQVAHLLFEVLKFPSIKKTKTGESTDVEVLEELASLNISPVPKLLLRYRELEKMLSTYIKTLPLLIDPATSKIHAHFNQFLTVTGRLSCENPNLQNIPVRSEAGKKIRKAFVATPGKLLLSCDYSQIELRILAHYSDDPVMVAAFNRDGDIHAETAAEMVEKPLHEVTNKDRALAKTVNFGLMYGQSSFGLASTLSISRNDAKEYMEKYFVKFKKVKEYLEGLKELGRQRGYAETFCGRRRKLKDINSSNKMIRAHAERLAINAPIQGTAADLIKLAMVKIEESLMESQIDAELILSVHDELIFEVSEEGLLPLKTLVKEVMEKIVTFKVPLKVSENFGINWYDLK